MAFNFGKPSIQLRFNNILKNLGDILLNERTYKEKIVLIACMLGVIGFIPFTVYRFLEGDYLLAFIESCLAISIQGLFVYVWRTHKIELPAIIMCLLFLSVTVVAVHIKGPSLIYWAYPVTLSCFCILNSRTASTLSIITMFMLLPALYPTLGSHEVILIYTNLVLLCMLGYTFTIIAQRQHIELSKLAARDGLTGAWNRRALDDAMQLLISKHHRKAISASIIIMDIDRFKKINDTYGHGIGDQILISISDLLHSVVRVSDQIYRYGGEEFVLIAEDTNLEEASVLAENIRIRVERSQLFEKQKVTISLGIAELTKATSAKQWLGLADDALYQAKKTGRNRYCIAQQSTVTENSQPTSLIKEANVLA